MRERGWTFGTLTTHRFLPGFLLSGQASSTLPLYRDPFCSQDDASSATARLQDAAFLLPLSPGLSHRFPSPHSWRRPKLTWCWEATSSVACKWKLFLTQPVSKMQQNPEYEWLTVVALMGGGVRRPKKVHKGDRHDLPRKEDLLTSCSSVAF